MLTLRFVRIHWLAAVVIASSFSSHAQVGSGWIEIHPNQSLQLRGAAAWRSDGGIETFSITNSVRAGDHRSEQRVWDDYTAGTHQFEGYLKVASFDGNFITVKQTFRSGTGAWFLCTVDPSANGTLRDHQRGTILATNVLGRTVRLNTVHDIDAGLFYVYVDGVLKETRMSDPGVAYNDKYGTYRAVSGNGPITVEWSRIRIWKSGTTNEPVASVSGQASGPSETNGVSAMR